MAQVFSLSAVFGDKAWFKSLTAWGLVIGVGGMAVLDQVCTLGFLSAETCATAQKWAGGLGVVLGTLGIRRAATAKNVE